MMIFGGGRPEEGVGRACEKKAPCLRTVKLRAGNGDRQHAFFPVAADLAQKRVQIFIDAGKADDPFTRRLISRGRVARPLLGQAVSTSSRDRSVVISERQIVSRQSR